MDPSDKDCLARYRAGDVEALSELVEAYRRPLFAFILRMIPGHDEAEDVFQEVWIRAIRNLDRYKDKRLISWLFRIAHNLVIDQSRKKKPDFNLQDLVGEDMAREDRIASPGRHPGEDAENKDMGARVAAAIMSLPEEQREVFVWRMEADMPFKEIARIQKTSINTALARMSYAVKKMRAELADDYGDLSR